MYTLIFLNGLGDNTNGFLNLFLDHKTHGLTPLNCKIVLLAAPVIELTMTEGMKVPCWFDMDTNGEPNQNDLNNSMIKLLSII